MKMYLPLLNTVCLNTILPGEFMFFFFFPFLFVCLLIEPLIYVQLYNWMDEEQPMETDGGLKFIAG